MRAEQEIRDMLTFLRLFNDGGQHEKEIKALEWVMGEYPPPPKTIIHGVNCHKVHHTVRGIGHLETEDGPVVESGIRYCGRCHVALGPAV